MWGRIPLRPSVNLYLLSLIILVSVRITTSWCLKENEDGLESLRSSTASVEARSMWVIRGMQCRLKTRYSLMPWCLQSFFMATHTSSRTSLFPLLSMSSRHLPPPFSLISFTVSGFVSRFPITLTRVLHSFLPPLVLSTTAPSFTMEIIFSTIKEAAEVSKMTSIPPSEFLITSSVSAAAIMLSDVFVPSMKALTTPLQLPSFILSSSFTLILWRSAAALFLPFIPRPYR
mmetsp:Transcript_8677/g.15756  ORF Transcript_8677/g.15756 Transcript_8677/m.15756 type:complete len:230 (-) Transcript_8677:1302-1991(-)